jgi:cytochrome c556
MKFVASLALAAAAATLAVPAHAQFAKPEDAIKYRKSALTVMATHFGRVGAMAAGRIPFDANAAAANAAIAESMSKLPWAAFVEGSGAGDTKAKPEIWRNQADFQRLMTDLREKTAQLATTASSGTLDSIRPAFIAASSTCKACHDKYKLD